MTSYNCVCIPCKCLNTYQSLHVQTGMSFAQKDAIPRLMIDFNNHNHLKIPPIMMT